MPDIFNINKLKRKTKNPTVTEKPAGIEATKMPTETQKVQKPKNKLSGSVDDSVPSVITTPNPQDTSASQNPLRIFTTFLKNPSGISFTEQDTDENIVLFLRRSFSTNTSWLIATIVLILIPILVKFIADTTNFTLPIFSPNFITVFNIFYYLVVLGFAFSNFLTWFYTIGLVTSERAVDIDFVDISSIKFAAADLNDILDAKYTQNGFSQSFFDYGNIELVIQAPQEKLSFDNAPKPAEVSNIIDDLIKDK